MLLSVPIIFIFYTRVKAVRRRLDTYLRDQTFNSVQNTRLEAVCRNHHSQQADHPHVHCATAARISLMIVPVITIGHS